MASDNLERALTKASAGLALSHDEYKRKREDIQEEKALNALKRIAGGAAPATAAPTEDPVEPSSEKKKKKKDKKNRQNTLSFDDELEQEAEGISPVNGGMAAARAREEQLKAQQQEAAMREVLQQQRAMRSEPLALHYTFRSEMTQREFPSGVHKGVVHIQRGFTADEAAVAVRTDVEKLGGKFAPNAVQGIREERDVLLVVCCEGMEKGSFVAPGAVSLVELWTRKWADQPTPMFDEFRPGVVVTERRWYESQRHTYPYSHWRLYDSLTEYSHKEFIASRDRPAVPFEPRRESKAAANKR